MTTKMSGMLHAGRILGVFASGDNHFNTKFFDL